MHVAHRSDRCLCITGIGQNTRLVVECNQKEKNKTNSFGIPISSNRIKLKVVKRQNLAGRFSAERMKIMLKKLHLDVVVVVAMFAFVVFAQVTTMGTTTPGGTLDASQMYGQATTVVTVA